MPANQIQYSEKYYDDVFEYRSAISLGASAFHSDILQDRSTTIA